MTLVLNLGGTIGLTYVNGEPRSLRAADVLGVPELRYLELTQVQSYALEWSDLVRLRSALLEEGSKGESHFIVLTGTDSVSELVTFLGLCELPGRVAVLVSLATRDEAAPAPSQHARAWLDADDEPELSLWCDDRRLDVTAEKVLDNGRWNFQARPALADQRLPLLPSESGLSATMPRIPITPIGIGAADWICPFLARHEFDAVVVEAYAAGDVPPPVANAVEIALAEGRPVVVASLSRPGRVSSAFPGLKGASAELLERGALSAGALPPQLARIRLAVALAGEPEIHPATAFEAL